MPPKPELSDVLENLPEAERLKLAEQSAQSHAFAIPERGHDWQGKVEVDEEDRVVFTNGMRAVRAAALILISRYMRKRDAAHANALPHLQELWADRKRGHFIVTPDFPADIYDDVADAWSAWRDPGDALNIDNLKAYLWDLNSHLKTPGVLLDGVMIDMGVHNAGLIP